MPPNDPDGRKATLIDAVLGELSRFHRASLRRRAPTLDRQLADAADAQVGTYAGITSDWSGQPFSLDRT